VTQLKFGAFPSPPDPRDYPVGAFLPPVATTFPSEYTLPFRAPILDQGNTSMCMDFSCRTLKEVQEWVERGYYAEYGNGYVYGTRPAEEYQGEGMYPRQAFDTLRKKGIPLKDAFHEVGSVEWCKASVEAQVNVADPSAEAQKVLSYAVCESPEDIKGALFHLRSPVVITIAATKRFVYLTPANGVVVDESPESFLPGTPNYLGGHAMVVIGWRYIDGRLYWQVQNSWGESFGEGGVCYIPFDYGGLWELWTVTDKRPQGPTLRFRMGSKTVTLLKDGADTLRQADTAPFLMDGRTQVPLRAFTDAVAELLGVKIAVLPVTDETGLPQYVDLVLMKE
jgi:hypothetical protein